MASSSAIYTAHPCSDICKNYIGGECLNLKTVSPESADSLDDDVLDDAIQAFNDDSDTETFAGKINYTKFFTNVLFFVNKFFNVVFFSEDDEDLY